MGILEQVLEQGNGNVMVTMTAADLRTFAQNVAREASSELARNTVSAIRSVMGDSMEYCTTEETMKILRISRSTLYWYNKKDMLTPCRIGGRNLYLRDEVLALKIKR